MDPKNMQDMANRLAKGGRFSVFGIAAVAAGYGMLKSLYTGNDVRSSYIAHASFARTSMISWF